MLAKIAIESFTKTTCLGSEFVCLVTGKIYLVLGKTDNVTMGYVLSAHLSGLLVTVELDMHDVASMCDRYEVVNFYMSRSP